MSSSPGARSAEDPDPGRSHLSWRTEAGVVFMLCVDTSGFLRVLDPLTKALRGGEIKHLKIDVERDERDHLWVRIDAGKILGDHLEV